MGPSMIGILIIAHDSLGEGLARAVTHVLGSRPPQFEVLSVPRPTTRCCCCPRRASWSRTSTPATGVLVFSDIYGATPCNLVGKLLRPGRVEGIAGVNLPMLVRAFTYRNRGMETMVKKAISGGCEGVLHMEIGSRPMPQREVEIINKLGLHARASAKLTQLAAKYQCDVAMSRNNRKVNAKSIMGVMMLAAGKGAKVTSRRAARTRTRRWRRSWR